MAAGVDTTEGTVLDALDGVHPMLAALAGVRSGLARAAAGPVWSLSDAQVVAAVGELLAVRSSTEALTASLVGQVESRGVRAQLGLSSTARWLQRRFRLSGTEAGRLTGLAERLPRWAATGAALTDGTVGVAAAAAIVTVLDELPATTSGVDATRAEELLLEQAATLDPGELARCGRALREALTVVPDVDDPAEAAAAARELTEAETTEASWWARRGLRLVRRRDGMVGITGHLDPLAGPEVREVLEAAARPVDAVDGVRDERNPEQRLVDALVEVVTTSGPLDLDEDAGMTRLDHPTRDPATGDTGDTGDTRATGATGEADDTAATAGEVNDEPADDADDAGQDPDLDDIDGDDGLDHSRDGGLGDDGLCGGGADPVLDFDVDCGARCDLGYGAPAGCDAPAVSRAARRARRPRVTARPAVAASVILDWRALQAGMAGAGTLPDGTTLSPGATLAALCDAGIIPMVFDSPGRPLHVGRASRGFTPPMRRALAARDRGCTWPGCHRRASCCAAHHLIPWAEGGDTDIDNALLCRYHHQLLHREGWTGHLDARGRPEYRPPAAIDPERRPRQHLRFAAAPAAA